MESLSFERALQLWPVLVCKEGLLRSSKPSVFGTWVWKNRCFVILDSEAVALFQNNNNPAPAVLLIYNAQGEDQSHPTRIIQCTSPSSSSQEGEDSINNNIAFRVNTIHGHQRHVEIKLVSTSSATTSRIRTQNYWSSSPFLQGYDRGARIMDHNGDEEAIRGVHWRLKLPDCDTALLWKDMICGLEARHRRRIQERNSVGISTRGTATTRTESQQQPSRTFTNARFLFVAFTTVCLLLLLGRRIYHFGFENKGASASERPSNHNRRNTATKSQPEEVCSQQQDHYFLLNGTESVGRKTTANISSLFIGHDETNPSSLKAPANESGAPANESGTSSDANNNEKGKKEENNKVFKISLVEPSKVVATPAAMIHTLIESTWDTLFQKTSENSSGSGSEKQETNRPNPEKTPLRIALSRIFQLTLPAGSFMSEYFWLLLPTAIIFVISATSVLCKIFPWLLHGHPIITNMKPWVASVSMFLVGTLIAHDAYVNCWNYPLAHGLYWEGYIRSLIAASFLGASCAMARRELRRRRRRGRSTTTTLTFQRKMAAATSGLLTSLAIPLAVRSIDVYYSDMSSPSSAWKICAVLAFFSCFVGLHFFGWALRETLVVSGVRVGEVIYQFSFIPTNITFAALSLLGTICQYLVTRTIYLAKVTCTNILFISRIIWQRFLKHVVEKLYNFTRDALSRLNRVLNWMADLVDGLLLVFNRVLGVALRWMVTSLSYLWKIVESSANFVRWAATVIYLRMCSVCVTIYTHVLEPLLQATHTALKALLLGVKKTLTYSIKLMKAFVCNAAEFLYSVCVAAYEYVVEFLRALYIILRTTLLWCVTTIDSILRLTLGWVYDVGTVAYVYIVTPLLRMAVRSLNVMKQIVFRAVEGVKRMVFCCLGVLNQIVTQQIYPVACYVFAVLCNAVIAILDPFVKKYWQLIPAGLSFYGSFLYVGSAIRSSQAGGVQAAISGVQFASGGWALFLIGYTVLYAVMSSSGNLVQQRVVLDQSVMQYVDFYLFRAVGQIISSGWYATGAAFGILLAALDFMIRKTSSAVLELLQNTLRPVLRFVRSVVQKIWESPYFSLLASVLIMLIAHLHHQGKLPTLEIAQGSWTTRFSSSIVDEIAAVGTFWRELQLFCNTNLIAPATSGVTGMVSNVYEPLYSVEVSSPSVGLSCWIFTCFVAKTRHSVRIKTLAVPVLVFYLTGVNAAALFLASLVTTVIWLGLSILVDHYENQERAVVRNAFRSFRHRRRHRTSNRTNNAAQPPSKPEPALDGSEVNETEVCAICLDEFKAPINDGCPCKLYALPCGHTFHDSCIKEWLNESLSHQRCPICRRAAGGRGRVLEVLF